MTSLTRYAFTVFIATVLTLGTFYLMHLLIDRGPLQPASLDPVTSIHFGPVVIPETPTPRQPRIPPEKPEPVEQPPAPVNGPITSIQSDPIAVDEGELAVGPEFSFTASVNPHSGNADRQAGPRNPRPPLYPPRAARENLEGWVEVEVTIDENGIVRSTRVVDSRPRGVFESAALNAVRSWHWQPRLVDGTPVTQTVVQRIDFALQD